MKYSNILQITKIFFVLLLLSGTALSSDTTWSPIPIRTHDQYLEGAGSARQMQYMTDGARCESNPNIMYLAHDCGGFWRSTDGGMSWNKTLQKGLYAMSGMSIEVDPVDCNRVVGVWSDGSDLQHPDWDGIFLTTDGGDNWTFEQHTATSNFPLQDGQRFHQENVKWAPTSVDGQGAQIWYAVGMSDPTRSGSPHFDASNMAIYQSIDRGVNWTLKSNVTAYYPIHGIAVSPSSSSTILMASGTGLKRSTNSGSSFSSIGNIPAGPITSVVYDPNNSNVIYATVIDSSANGLYKSTNGGTAFSRVSHSSWNTTLYDAYSVFNHPSNSNIYYVVPWSSSGDAIWTNDGGTNYYQTNISNQLLPDVAAYKWGKQFNSTFAFFNPAKNSNTNVSAQMRGAAMTYSTNGYTFYDAHSENSSFHYVNWAVQWDPSNPNRCVASMPDGGSWLTENNGLWWEPRNYSGGCSYGTQQATAIDPTDSDIWLSLCVTSGTSAKVIRSTNSGQGDWTTVDADSDWRRRILFHPTRSGYAYSWYYRSTNHGVTWSAMSGRDPGDQVMDYCISNPDLMYITVVGSTSSVIRRSTDAGDSWSTYVSPSWNLAPITNNWIPTFAVDQNNCDVVWTVDSNRDLAKYDGSSWTSKNLLSRVNAPSGFWLSIASIIVDPNNANVIYATVSGNGVTPSIFRSQNGGATWDDISFNHYLQGSQGLAVAPDGRIFTAGGCNGIWSLDAPYASQPNPPENLTIRGNVKGLVK